MKNLKQILNNEAPSHLYPFFWQKGQKLEVIEEYIDQMYAQGIRNFCIESRPHPEFLEEGWWNTMNTIIAKAEEKDMHMWILDDDKFPTGHANGKVPEELRRRYLQYHCFDIHSNGVEIQLNMNCLCGMRKIMQDKRHLKDKAIAVIAVKKDIQANNQIVEGSEIDLSDKLEDGLLTCTLPDGAWSIFAIYETLCSEGRGVEEYLDPMRKEATQVLLSQVYEKHYAHYGEHFGKTILGFFSDEPSFGNANGRNEIIGKSDMPLPWNEDIYAELKVRGFERKDLIYLYRGNEKHASNVRYNYMDIITMLYQKNFTDTIGAWCFEHGVIYVGHVIEDDNVHARLGAGPGHYFRAVDGQDMAGVDIIGGQVVPGMPYHHDSFSTGGSDGEFYHYALVRMGASAAKLDPKKKGRLMCEAFGAYGWAEGLKEMKWITDHMISHGVNWIVPHAFDPSEFPDWDCPPHFYAHGMNPQYKYFHIWSAYADRLCHLFSDGKKDASIGVLYHAKAEWSGETMMFQKPCHILQENQIDTDIISEDYLSKAVKEKNGFSINGCLYEALVIPGCERLPEDLVEVLNDLSLSTKIYAIDCVADGVKAEIVTLEELPELLQHLSKVHVNEYAPYLVSYHYELSDGEAWMFTNESIVDTVKTQVKLDTNEVLQIYDAMRNELYHLEANKDDKAVCFDLELAPYESIILVSGSSDKKKPYPNETILEVKDEFTIAMQAYNEESESETGITSLVPLSHTFKDFSGTIFYRFSISLDRTDVMMVIPKTYETVHVTVNGMDCGTLIAPKYEFDIEKALHEGDNTVEIEVISTLNRSQKDLFSIFVPIEPLGILSPIEFKVKEMK